MDCNVRFAYYRDRGNSAWIKLFAREADQCEAALPNSRYEEIVNCLFIAQECLGAVDEFSYYLSSRRFRGCFLL